MFLVNELEASFLIGACPNSSGSKIWASFPGTCHWRSVISYWQHCWEGSAWRGSSADIKVRVCTPASASLCWDSLGGAVGWAVTQKWVRGPKRCGHELKCLKNKVKHLRVLNHNSKRDRLPSFEKKISTGNLLTNTADIRTRRNNMFKKSCKNNCQLRFWNQWKYAAKILSWLLISRYNVF